MTDDGKREPFVAAMGRGFAILQVFADADEWLGNGEIAARSGLPKSTVSRATSTLEQMHCLDFDPAEQKYRLGAAVLELAGRVTSIESLRRVMRPHFQDLADATRGSVGAAFLTEQGLHYFEHCRADAGVVLALSVGSTVPVLGTAVGRAYLAAASDSERSRLLRETEARRPEEVPELQTQWRESAAEYARLGFCHAYGTWKTEVNAIARPYRVPCSGLLLAISLGGPAFSLPERDFHEDFSQRLKACLDVIDREFGRSSGFTQGSAFR